MSKHTSIKTCPVCNMEMSGGEYKLQDGKVCKNCVDFLRFAIPITYIPNPHPFKKCKPDLSEVFEGEDLTDRQKANMIEELRNLPLNRVDPDPKYYYTVDRMRALTVREFKDKVACAQALRNELLRRYNDYDTVCTVATVKPFGQLRATEGIMKMKSLQGALIVHGMLRLGKMRVGDTVTVLRNGAETGEAEIVEIGYLAGCLTGEYEGTYISGELQKVVEGHQVGLLLIPRAKDIVPGDLLVADD